MRPETLLLAFGTVPVPAAGPDSGANASKTGTYTGTGSSFTIPSFGATGTDNAIIATFSIVTNTGLAAARTISSITGYATSWTLVQRKSMSVTVGGNTYANTLETWVGKIATAPAPATLTVNFSGAINEHVVYNIKTYNLVDQTSPIGSIIGGAQNGSTTPSDTTGLITSSYKYGVEIGIIQNPDEFIPNVQTAGFTQQAANGSKVIGSRIAQAWKPYSNALLRNDPVSYGIRDLWQTQSFTLRQSSQDNQPASSPFYRRYMLVGGALATGTPTTNADAVAVNDYVLVHINVGRNGGVPPTITSVTDNNGTTYTKLASALNTAVATAQMRTEVWGAKITAANAGLQVSATFSNTNGNFVITAGVFGGVNTANAFALPAETHQNNSASNLTDTGSFTPPYDNTQLVMFSGSLNLPYSAGAPWTVYGEVSAASSPQICVRQYYVFIDQAGFAISGVPNQSNWINHFIALKGI